ncbi:MAG: lasso peptide biosynthesis B2 protein [Candidatus Eremiobacteraeota bacterium]|nr:lasso peptide biosynthesis B2 protein [Candidatus Eremiobacteraeota bacterium]
MVNGGLAPKWTPAGFLQRARAIIKRPSDVWLATRIGWFMWRAPIGLRQRNLRTFLTELRKLPRPAALDAHTSRERILRLRALCLRFPMLRSRDNCYIRALTLYRFLETGDHAVTIHFGIEEPADPHQRLRGHAWVSVDGQFFEGPPEVLNARIRTVPLMVALDVS